MAERHGTGPLRRNLNLQRFCREVIQTHALSLPMKNRLLLIIPAPILLHLLIYTSMPAPPPLSRAQINKLEKPKLTPPETYIMCKATPFEKFPSVTLKIIDKDNTFLADSGATHSVIRAKELPHSVVELDFILGVAIG